MIETTDQRSDDQPRVRGYKFVVGATPFCVWDWDVPGKNLRFVDSLNPEYFGYLADTLAPDLDSDHKLLAGSAIRAAYGLGLETMFSVLFAALQAPGCIAGWLHKYKPEALRDLARRASAGVPYLNYPLLTGHSFDDIAKMMHSPLNLRQGEAGGADKRLRAVTSTACK